MIDRGFNQLTHSPFNSFYIKLEDFAKDLNTIVDNALYVFSGTEILATMAKDLSRLIKLKCNEIARKLGMPVVANMKAAESMGGEEEEMRGRGGARSPFFGMTGPHEPFARAERWIAPSSIKPDSRFLLRRTADVDGRVRTTEGIVLLDGYHQDFVTGDLNIKLQLGHRRRLPMRGGSTSTISSRRD